MLRCHPPPLRPARRTRRAPRAGLALAALASAACIAAAARPARAAEIVDPGQGAFELARRNTGATGLSGLTYLGGNRFLAVSDRGRRLFPLVVRIDPRTGRVFDADIERGPQLASALDSEGIAFTGGDTVFVCDETGPAVREHRIADGAVVRAVAVPKIFASARTNMSLEGLALGDDGALWIVNEEALLVDGDTATDKRGTWVRLQRFERRPDAGWRSTGQWGYRTDPIPGHAMGGWERSGAVDLAGLPGGGLLVLERGLGTRGLRSRIYEIDLSSATDTSDVASLDAGGFQPVRKRLLWEAEGLGDNFEGIALGPPLADGARSLLLISDDGAATLPRLYPLRIRTSTGTARTAPTRTAPGGSPLPDGPTPRPGQESPGG